MRIKINVKLFNKELDKLLNVVNSDNVLNTPIFKNILIRVFNDSMDLIVSNGFFSYKATLKAQPEKFIIEKTGEGLILIKQTNELFKKITSKTILMEIIDTSSLIVATSKSRFTMFIQDTKNYPEIDFKKIEEADKIELDFFKKVNKKIAFAADSKQLQTNPALKGVYVSSDLEKTSIIASNTHRLAKTELDPIKIRTESIIKASTFALVSKIFSKKEDIYMGFDENKTQIYTEKGVLQAQNIKAKYPEIENIIPKEFKSTVISPKDELLQILDKVSVFDSQDKRINIKITDTSFTISTNPNQYKGSMIEKVENFNKNGEDIYVSASSRYLEDALRAIKNKEIQLKFTSNTGLFVVCDDLDTKTTHLISPFRSK